jgi:hypothetical protein
MSLSVLKELGYGRSLGESRINVEVDNLIDSISKLNGRSFDPQNLLYRCINGVITGFMFGRNFDYGTNPLQLQVNEFLEAGIAISAPEIDLFPLIGFLPSYRKRVKVFIAASRFIFCFSFYLVKNVFEGKFMRLNRWVSVCYLLP